MAKGSSSDPYGAFSCHVSSISFSLEEFLGLLLTFKTSTLLKTTSQLFWRMSLNLGLPDVCSWLDSGYIPLAGLWQKWHCTLHSVRWSSISVCPITDEFALITWLKWYVLGFSTVKLFFVINKYFGGFPGGAVVETLPANAGDTGSSPGLGRSHMPQSN